MDLSRRLIRFSYLIGSWLFPALTELQIMLLYGVTAGMVLAYPDVIRFFSEFAARTAHGDIGATIYDLVLLAILFYPLVAILRRKTLSDTTKLIASTLYFTALAILAIGNMGNTKLAGGAPGSPAWFSYWLVWVVLGLAVARSLISMLVMRLDDPAVNRFVIGNFRDTQYRLAAFVLTAAAGIGSTLIVHRFYSDPLTVATLSLVYSGIVISLLGKVQRFVIS